MALLVAGSAQTKRVNAWLGAREDVSTAMRDAARRHIAHPAQVLPVTAAAIVLSLAARWAAGSPWTAWMAPVASSASGRAVLVVTTAALLASCLPRVRAAGMAAGPLGSGLLLFVLASVGAQASLRGLAESPVWLAFGVITVAVHGTVMLVVGRWQRWPLGLLATASQANVGGVVSAPLVGAVYEQALVPVGLVLAMAGNAAGTYIGLLAAHACRWLLANPPGL
jgi:uncharacterized membrane protein